jgi:hypothetical protein
MRDYHTLFLPFVERHNAIEAVMVRESFNVKYLTRTDEFRSIITATDRYRQMTVVPYAHGVVRRSKLKP